MAVIDFKEIPKANEASGEQDRFELFAREFFHALGFMICVDPDRGQDGGRDLIIAEKRTGLMGETEIRWLVSCKHRAHSGASVTAADEEDISDRIQAHRCSGFIGFYSTIVSAPLNRKLEALSDKYEIQIFDREKIERILLENREVNKLIARFFPVSYDRLEQKTPSNLLSEYAPLRCRVCGKDLLHKKLLNQYAGIVVFAWDMDYYEENECRMKYVDVYCVCKGDCDRKMENSLSPKRCITSWEDISDLVIPFEFLKFIIAIMNCIRAGEDIYTDEAYERLKQIIIALAQIVVKQQSDADIERVKSLMQLPEGF